MDNCLPEYIAFISYSREDESYAKRLQRQLGNYKLPTKLNGDQSLPRRVRPIFRDETDYRTGNLSSQIEATLEKSRYLIVVCSPNAAQSKWVNKEIEYFKQLGRVSNIIPYIVKGKPFASDPSEECYPLGIRQLPKEQELLGADINKSGSNDAVIKMIAQMFELSYDTLKQRYERKKNIRFLFFTLVVMLLSLASITLGLIYRNQSVTIKKKYQAVVKSNRKDKR